MLLLLLACRDPDPAGGTLEDLGPAGLLGRNLRVGGPRPRTVVCTSPDDPEERHVLPDVQGDVAVYGLLALTTWRCAAGADAVSFRTDALPDLPSFTVEGETTGYTLFDTQRGASWDDDPTWLVVVDPEGRPRWVYEVGTELVTDIDAQVFDGGEVHVGGGWAYFAEAQPNKGVFRDVDLAGNVLLERAVPDFGRGFNHHSERLADGTYLSLTGSTDRIGDHSWNGVGVELWDPDEGLLWTWQTQGAVDEGLLPEPDADTPTPWLANAVALVTDAFGDGAWISIYSRKELWRIDRATGEPTHLVGQGSDWTLQDPLGNVLPDADWPWSQHDPEWTDDGRVLLYDNGNGRPGGSSSRVAEYAFDPVAHVATLLWTWTEPGWYDPTLGDADRLPDGHVLVAQGFNSNKTPDSPDTSEILELDPPDEVVWRLTFDSGEWPMYRAERVDGCELFANARYCDRLEDSTAVQ